MHVHRWGEGPPILLVHGGILGGRHAWRAQRELASRWALLAVDRPGHGETPLEGVQDYRRDAELLEQVIEDPVHAVGLSYGCFGLMLAAAARQEMIRSLTVIEPPFPAIAADVPEVQRWEARLRALGAGDRDDIVEALREFYEIFGVRYPVPDPLPAPLAQGVTALRGARLPDHPAALPLAALSAADFPKLVVSGRRNG